MSFANVKMLDTLVKLLCKCDCRIVRNHFIRVQIGKVEDPFCKKQKQLLGMFRWVCFYQ